MKGINIMAEDITAGVESISPPQDKKTEKPDSGNKAGFSVPTDFVPIPSKGVIYPPESSLHMKEQLEVRFLTASDEDILTSRSLLRSGKALDYLLSSCIVDKTIKVDEMISGDKNAILTFLRITGYGPEYKTEIRCSSCSNDVEYDFDLGNIGVKDLEIQPEQKGDNRFKFDTPSGFSIEFKFLNTAEERQISELQEKMKKATNSPLDQNITIRLKNHIISVNGDSDKEIINKYVENMPVRDSRAIRKYIEDHEPDLDMKQDFSCPHCGNSEEVEMPISVSFFWPDS